LLPYFVYITDDPYSEVQVPHMKIGTSSGNRNTPASTRNADRQKGSPVSHLFRLIFNVSCFCNKEVCMK